MEFSLQISRDNVTYYDVDLFPEQQLDYDLDFYDSVEIDKVKLPFYTTLRIPLTTNNKASNRFDFEPLSSLTADYPKEDFYFKIKVYGNSTVEIGGILNVKSFEYNSSESYIEVELKDYLSKYLAQIKSISLGDLYTDTYYTSRHTVANFKLSTASGGEAGQPNINPDYTRPISFPYIDFCNDIDGKFGYAARQFAEYGPGIDRTGFQPVFSVSKFLEQIGRYVNSASFPVRVDSKLFALGNYASSPAFVNFQAEKLHMVVPSQLLAKQDVNTRNFTVRQSPAWVGVNESFESCEDLDNNQKLIHTSWFGNMETAGNYGTDGEGNPLYDTLEWGAEKRMGFYPDDLNEGIRGFFCPKVSFNSSLGLSSGNTSALITGLKYEIPIVQEDKMVVNIFPSDPSSTMTFRLCIGIYEDGLIKKQIPLQDALGNDLVLDTSTATPVQGYSNKNDYNSDFEYFACRTGAGILNNAGAIISFGANWYDTLEFEPTTVYFPQDAEMFIYGGSQYSVNYFLEPIDGALQIEYIDDYFYQPPSAPIPPYWYQATTALSAIEVEDIKKAITRIGEPNGTGDYGLLNIKFAANQDFLIHKLTDEFIISDSINKTCPLTVSEILVSVLKRFDCGLFYEFDVTTSEHILRIDPLHLARRGGQDVNQYVDDLKSVKIFNGGDKVKTIEINNKDYSLYFDDLNNDDIVIGSTLQTINNEGISEIKIDLDSSIYYKSVCGEESDQSLFTSNFGAFSAKELGFTENVFTKNKDVGLRFAYLDKPVYRTNLLTPFVKLKGNDISGKMETETQVIYINHVLGKHIFNGRLFPYNTAGWSLMFEDEDGNTTDTYDNIFAVSEKILQSENPRIEFDMVVPTSDLSSLDFFLQTLSATRFTANSILVKSAKGEVFDDYAYLTIEGILQ